VIRCTGNCAPLSLRSWWPGSWSCIWIEVFAVLSAEAHSSEIDFAKEKTSFRKEILFFYRKKSFLTIKRTLLATFNKIAFIVHLLNRFNCTAFSFARHKPRISLRSATTHQRASPLTSDGSAAPASGDGFSSSLASPLCVSWIVLRRCSRTTSSVAVEWLPPVTSQTARHARARMCRRDRYRHKETRVA